MELTTVNTALCLWEAHLEAYNSAVEREGHLRSRFDWLVIQQREDEGAATCRDLMIDLAAECDAAWEALSDDEKDDAGCFDWEFVPEWLKRKLVGPEPVQYDCHDKPLPYAEFEKRYGVVTADDGHLIREWDDAVFEGVPVYRQWSVVDDGEGELFVVPGWAKVNLLGRILTERTWAGAEQGSAGYEF